MKDVAKKLSDVLVVGWVEHLDFPALGLHRIRAKMDTGARTSALHATNIEVFVRNTANWVRFQSQHGDENEPTQVEAPIYDRRMIKNTGGDPEERFVIRTEMKLVGRPWLISVSLTDRSNMRFPLLIGRTALRQHNIAVHTKRKDLIKTRVH